MDLDTFYGCDEKFFSLAPIISIETRAPEWPSFRFNVVKEQPFCEFCGGRKLLQLHHKKMFSLWPELELHRENVCVLCECPEKKCHYRIGHLGISWETYNPYIDLMLKAVRDKPNKKDNKIFEAVKKFLELI